MISLYDFARKLVPRPIKRRLLRLRTRILEPKDFSWTVRSGVKIKVLSKSDWVIYNDIFVDGEYDLTIKEALRSAPHDRTIRVLDLGANVGFFTLRFLDLLRQSEQRDLPHQLTLVEGSPSVVSQLKGRLLEDNTLESEVRIVHGLVGEREGSARISEHDFPAMSSLYFDQNAEAVNVNFVNVNSLFQSGEVIDLLKCDIEGSELTFIENYGDLLRSCRLAVFELHHDKCDTARCMKILAELGFTDQRVIRKTPTFSVCHFAR